MTTRKRVSLGERNRAAIAAAPVPPEHDQAPPVATPPVDTPAEAARRRAPKAAQPARAGESATVRLGIYFHPEEFDRAKAAYLADWQHGGQADTFARWIAAAMDTHARRSTQERAVLAKPANRDRGSGGTRSFTLPADSVGRMRAAIAEDQAVNRWPTDSGWCGDAVAAAVGLAEQRAGGQLPPAPPRLPNRLTR